MAEVKSIEDRCRLIHRLSIAVWMGLLKNDGFFLFAYFLLFLCEPPPPQRPHQLRGSRGSRPLQGATPGTVYHQHDWTPRTPPTSSGPNKTSNQRPAMTTVSQSDAGTQFGPSAPRERSDSQLKQQQQQQHHHHLNILTTSVPMRSRASGASI